MKSFNLVWLMLILMLTASWPGYGHHQQPLKIVTEVLPPLQIQEADNSATGATVEIVKAILKQAKLNTQINIQPWARAYQTAQAEPNTLIFSLVRTPQREHQFHWLAKLYSIDAYLTTLSHHGNEQVTSLEQAKGYKVGVIRHDLSEDYLLDLGFEMQKNLFTSNSYKNLWAHLYHQQLDFIFTSNLIWRDEIVGLGFDPKQINLQIKVDGYGRDLYLAANLNTSPRIMTAVKQAFAEIKKSGLYQQILDKWHL